MNGFEPLNFSAGLIGIILLLWTIPWKVYAVWLTVKHNDKKWFLALIILNTVGLLEIFYIFKVAGKSWAQVKADFSRAWSSFQ
jgi:hypothetical protein